MTWKKWFEWEGGIVFRKDEEACLVFPLSQKEAAILLSAWNMPYHPFFEGVLGEGPEDLKEELEKRGGIYLIAYCGEDYELLPLKGGQNEGAGCV